ncbi:MAG: hypothetical protein R3C45_02285 [Phycisphaerales bacterium]
MALSLLQQEIKQTRPFPSPEVEAYLNLARTFGLLACGMERFFKGYGVSAAGYNVLRILNGAKRDGEEGLPTLEVAQRLVSPVPDVTRLIDRLVRDGLVTRDRARKTAGSFTSPSPPRPRRSCVRSISP